MACRRRRREGCLFLSAGGAHITYDPHANLVVVAGTLVVTLNPARVRPLPSPASTLVVACNAVLFLSRNPTSAGDMFTVHYL